MSTKRQRGTLRKRAIPGLDKRQARRQRRREAEVQLMIWLDELREELWSPVTLKTAVTSNDRP